MRCASRIDRGTRGNIWADLLWINASNLFDAAVGFGGYRESGYGREGAYNYLKPRAWSHKTQQLIKS